MANRAYSAASGAIWRQLDAFVGVGAARAEQRLLQQVADALNRELALSALAGPELSAVLDAAARHGVAGLLEHPAAMPLKLAAQAKSIRALRFTRRAVEALAQAGIAAVVLKGAAAAARWADPTVRMQSDLDVLVAPADLERAGEALQAAGVAGERFMTGEHMHNASFKPADAGGLLLELHHDLSSHHDFVADVPMLLNRREQVQTAQGPLPCLSKEDDAVYLALHACTHGLSRLAWLVDLQALHGAGVDWVEAARRAREWTVGLPVALAWEATRTMLCVPIEGAAFTALGVSKTQRAVARGLLEAANASGQPVHQFLERLFRLALVSPAALPRVVRRKVRAKVEETNAYAEATKPRER